MQKLKFYKYQGTGNDFVMIDNRDMAIASENVSLVKRLCDRKFGVGADGLILIQPLEGYDFEMIYFNADGTKSLCGNGCRSAVMFARHLGIVGNKASFMTIDGGLKAQVNDDEVKLGMPDVKKVEEIDGDYYVNTGSPHYVAFVDEVKDYPVFEMGRSIRNNEHFAPKGGTNVNFVQKLSDHEVFVRTYERGVEDETLSCGTGVTGVVLVCHFAKQMTSPVTVQTLGGTLQISFDYDANGYTNICLQGPAKKVFEGEIEI
ncbi:diaminopimelate epimerase [Aureibacter tunicatorum]|uniref:Diaminopimelate epimerase n=1 Tax=Aureibacter tunicatorum TaxID=866807 RepID=A0AAE3XH77_9BACT|nr:diaminopimelate epimerase [Aureibacter tunicatorum]MDR6237606.1 diaminopimelate epimerase [Aureibacter tunicatorum]BDD02640.1 diaminopimelate epimerase [Aureibacter tunicatorum]